MKKYHIFANLILLAGCNNSPLQQTDYAENDYYYLDIAGSSAPDTLIVRSNDRSAATRDIIWVREGKEERVVSVEPRFADSLYVLSQPQIETIRLEANHTQSADRGLRVILRNTDAIPDYIFVDMKYTGDKWFVKRYYLCNTQTGQPPYIRYMAADKPATEEFGEGLVVNQLEIYHKFM